MRLILVRHPAPQIAAGLCYGRSDIDVAPATLTAALATLAAALPPDLGSSTPVYTSPLRRCTALALPLAAQLGMPAPRIDARLTEIDFGDWELRPWDSIARAHIDAWAVDLLHYAPGGGETVLQAGVRVAGFLREALDESRRRQRADAIVVCHAGTMRLLAAMQPVWGRGADLAGPVLAAAALRAAATPQRIDYAGTLTLRF
ncbi:phosphoglycerate mutase [Massilia eurypsychrophila]|jgi:alpha-ribazole phosphatase|uniref:Phosphoglycerate mutase n=1 Tax=Massilia eurypsychrophila TaxID=1485217 RepID=A0A2G8T7W6_9BURK|nr:histidine phosphatase family protein [Massilia eurypsychrophila]PIL42102.1 phosphoglycerate mutase [Massilia eurypsychrophila]